MIVSFHYRVRNSLIEKLDPRARWFFSLLALFAIVQFWDVRFLLFFLALGLGQFFVARLTWRETRRAWSFIFVIITVMVVVNTILTSAGTVAGVFTGGHPVLQLQTRLPLFGWQINFVLTAERLWFALSQYVRVISISAMFIVLPFTMDPRSYGVTFRGMGLGDRLAFSFDLAFRFVPTLARDFSVTLDAQRARGYEVERLKGGIIAQIRRMAPLLVPVTMNAILSGEDITNAMDLRCFGLRKRTWVQTLTYRWFDYAWIGFGVFLFVGSLALRLIFQIGNFWLPPWLIPGS